MAVVIFEFGDDFGLDLDSAELYKTTNKTLSGTDSMSEGRAQNAQCTGNCRCKQSNHLFLYA